MAVDSGARLLPLSDLVSGHQRAPVHEVANEVPANPVVSVLVTTYQHAGFIGQCLDGILGQEGDISFEILVGEDASSDGTREICLDYAARFPRRIRLFLHDPANKIRIHGVGTGRFNLAYLMSRARGEFICLCEGDDYWRDPHKLVKQHGLLRSSPGAALVFTNSVVMRDGVLGNEMFLGPGQQRDIGQLEFATGARIPTQSIMFRNVFGTHPVHREFFDVLNGDSFLFWHLSCFGMATFQESVTPCVYRVHGGGMWSALDEARRLALAIDTKRSLRRLSESPQARRLFDEGIFRVAVSLAKLHMSSGNVLRALATMGRLVAMLCTRPRLLGALVAMKIGNRMRGTMARGGRGEG